MTNLYNVAAEYRAQLAVLADMDLDAQTVADTIEGLQGDLENKLRAVIAYSLDIDVLATGAAEAAKRMQERAKTLDARVEALRAYALKHMQETGIGEVATDEFSAKVAKKPASVSITDPAAIPAKFLRIPEPPPPAPDKRAIAEAIKAGESVPGAELVQGYRIAIN